MSRFRLVVAYDGTDFAGWQVQPGERTVQGELGTALERLTCECVYPTGSGRTDQGVHAKAQVAHVDVSAPWDPGDLHRAMNAVLQPDVRVMRLSRAAPDFHAQFDAKFKEYRYFINTARWVSPFDLRYCAHVRERLDVALMQAAADVLVGEHDFASFTANPNRVVRTTVREVLELSVRRRGNTVTIRAVGRGFLYKMVRSIAGYLIRVGSGQIPAESAGEILASCERTATVPTAEPHGLFLWRVGY